MSATPLIIVTGKNGQLGWELQQLAGKWTGIFDFLFVDADELDLSDNKAIAPFFEKYKPSYFINCAAYTAVDKAETEKEIAYTINAAAVEEIAKQCKNADCTLITVSTDYVFNGEGSKPYETSMKPDPVNYYGYTKYKGEEAALENNPSTIIIRTSWLYSPHGNNFVKTMMRLMNERDELTVVNDQVGSPTYAADLATAMMQIIESIKNGNKHTGIYHYSNTGVISWYDFAVAIRDLAKLDCKVSPVPSSAYPTPAKRPAYSVMDISGIGNDFGVSLKDWRTSLQECMRKLNN